MASTFRPTFGRSSSDSDSDPDCHVCKRMAQRKSITQVGGVALCLLCDRLYCETHKGKEEGVCEIRHTTYFSRHINSYNRKKIFHSLERRREVLGDEKGQKEAGGEGTKEEKGGEGDGAKA